MQAVVEFDPVPAVVVPAPQGVHALLGCASVPPALQVPATQAVQGLPPVPAAQATAAKWFGEGSDDMHLHARRRKWIPSFRPMRARASGRTLAGGVGLCGGGSGGEACTTRGATQRWGLRSPPS